MAYKDGAGMEGVMTGRGAAEGRAEAAAAQLLPGAAEGIARAIALTVLS
jgi:hypothetical protein